MRAALFVASGFGVSACGSHSATSTQDAAITGGDAVADLTLAPDAPSCPALPCLAHANAVIAACAPSGACTQQLNTAAPGMSVMTKCFANGVKIAVSGTRSASGATSMVLAVQKDGGACYSFSTEEQSNLDGTIVYRDGAGVELVSESVIGPTLSVACPGEPAVVPDSSCDAALYALGGLYPFTNATSCTTSSACAF